MEKQEPNLLIKIYLNEIGKYPILSEEESNECFDLMKNSDTRNEAREKLVHSNLRLVVHLVKNNFLFMSIPMSDAISEGNIALMNAVDQYDASQDDCTFASYASVGIIRRIRQATLAQSVDSIIRIPCYKVKAFSDFESDIDNEEPEYYIPLKNTISLNKMQEESGFYCPSDFDTEKSYIVNEEKILLQELLSILDDRSYGIIHACFCLDGQRRLGYEDIGKMYNISRERVRQIRKEVLQWLKEEIRSNSKYKSLEMGIDYV